MAFLTTSHRVEKKPFSFEESQDDLESQMMVCVRARPLLKHETAADFFQILHTSNPQVAVLEPVIKEWKADNKVSITKSSFNVDMAFAAEDDNDTVYDNTVFPLLHTSIKVTF